MARDGRILRNDLRRVACLQRRAFVRMLLLRADDFEHLTHRIATDLKLVAPVVALLVLRVERGGEERDEFLAPLGRIVAADELGQRAFDQRAVDRRALPDPGAQDRRYGVQRVAHIVHHRDRAFAAAQREALYFDLFAQVLQLDQHRIEAAPHRRDLILPLAVILEHAERSRIADALHVCLDPAEALEHQPRNHLAEHREDKDQQNRRSQYREPQHVTAEQRDIARHDEARRCDRLSVGAGDRHCDLHRLRIGGNQRAAWGGGKIDLCGHLERVAKLL